MEKVLVTGCSSGFGFDTVITLALHGFEVIATVRPSSHIEKLSFTIKELNLESKIHVEYLDMLEICQQQVQKLIHQYQGFDIVVFNAGVLRAGLTEEIALDEMQKMIETNLTSQIALASMLMPMMKEKQHGKMIFVSSLAASRPLPYLSSYNASKAGLLAYAKSLYLELAPYHIDVHLLEPGFYPTRLWDQKITCQDEYSKKLKRMSMSFKPKRDKKEVSLQILKICENDKKRFFYTFGFLNGLQLFFSPILYTKLGRVAYQKILSRYV